MCIQESNREQVQKLYEGTAEKYAAMMDQEIQSAHYTDVLNRLCKRIADLSGPLIDTSCGSGHMLALYHECVDADRELLGIDLVPGMVTIARTKLSAFADIRLGDMCRLPDIDDNTAAAVLSYFSLHHLDMNGVRKALEEWRRVLRPTGQLVIATWEGAGRIDYGEHSNIVALKHTAKDIRSLLETAGFVIDRCVTEQVEEMGMDAVYLEASAHTP